MRMIKSQTQARSFFTIALLMLGLSCATLPAQSEPGRRPDMAPSTIEFWASLESRTLEQIRKVKTKEDEIAAATAKRDELIKKQPEAKVGPWWSPFEDEKGKISREISEQTKRLETLEQEKAAAGVELENYLTSTPSGRTKVELEMSEYVLNKEAIEIRNSLENIAAIGARLVEEIRRNPKDTKKAVECYEAQLRALGYVQLMHGEFIRRTLEDYPRYLNDLEKACRDFQRKQQGVLLTFQGTDEDAAVISRTIDRATELAARIPTLRANVTEMRRWAERNLEIVRNKKVVLASLSDSAALVDRAKDIASSITAAFGELVFDEPPLVEFEFDPDSLELGGLRPGME